MGGGVKMTFLETPGCCTGNDNCLGNKAEALLALINLSYGGI